ncbi:hypothetical protein Z945_457 [Sulfitobacter noctilucae]|nr:hypothetical protein Z945_457 [Sulfitobacter noctilucae]
MARSFGKSWDVTGLMVTSGMWILWQSTPQNDETAHVAAFLVSIKWKNRA